MNLEAMIYRVPKIPLTGVFNSWLIDEIIISLLLSEIWVYSIYSLSVTSSNVRIIES